MLPVKFTKNALLDLEDAVLWYEEQRQGLSYDFELCLEVAIQEIQRTPEGFQQKYRNVKVIYMSRFPYGIHYIINTSEIIVLGIFQTSRSPKKWPGNT